MIGNVVVGGQFGGLINYCFKEDAVVISSQNLSQDKENWRLNMEMLSDSNPRLKKPVLHFSLSLPVGERLSNEEWQKAATVFANEMGAGEATQWFAVRHNDKDHDHIHIVMNRQQLAGKAISNNNSIRRTHKAAAEAARAVGREPIQKGQQVTSKKGLAEEIRNSIDKAMAMGNVNIDKFKNELRKDGINVILNQSKTTGKISGISFEKEGYRPLKGSSLGKEYTIAGLQQRGLQLNQNHDNQISQLASGQAGNQNVFSVAGGLVGAELSRLRAKGRTGGLSQADKDRAAEASRIGKPQPQQGMEM